MKKYSWQQYIGIVLVLLLQGFSYGSPLQAQEKMDSLSNFQWSMGLSSLWGYTAPNGREYALVGVIDGFSVVDITQPQNPQELFFLPQPAGFWREIKTWQHYAYVANETDEGILIVDLGQLPDTVYYTNYTADSLIKTSHALWIDEHGYAYIAGYNNFTGSIPVNNRGVAILDLNQDPMHPTLVNTYTDRYVHDMFVRDNVMYACEIYDGRFTVIDVSDKSNLVVLAHQNTPSLFTHNAWLSDNSQYLFTTDEKNNAYVAAYDISDLSDIKEIARYQSNPGSFSMPHNVHVLNDFLVISYYRDGVRIVDAHEPDILVETEYFDTSPLSGPGSQGCWGVYQLFPSGNIIASDRQYGLFTMRPQYKRASYLRGNVTDAQTGEPLTGVSVSVEIASVQTNSDFLGNFKTGLATEGSYTIWLSRYGYAPQAITANFVAGETVWLNVALEPLQPFTLQVQVTNAGTGAPLSGAFVETTHTPGVFTNVTDAAGLANFNNVFNDVYTVYAAHWGHIPNIHNAIYHTNDNNLIDLPLQPGYYDDFYTHLGWTTAYTGNNENGQWVITDPTGTVLDEWIMAPDEDIQGEAGTTCYITGNSSNPDPEDADVDFGSATLFSPPMDLSTYSNPYLSFYRWFASYNALENADSLSFYLSNGTDTALLQTIYPTDAHQRQWHLQTYRIADFITPSANMQFIAVATVNTPDGSIFEAGIDLFRVTDDFAPQVGLPLAHSTPASVVLYPNPAQSTLTLTTQNNSTAINEVAVFSLQGQLLYQTAVNDAAAYTLSVHDLPNGIYFVQVKTANGIQNLRFSVVK